MAQDFHIARIVLLLPHEIEAALAARSVVYVPLGTYEWHGRHLPIGLDALTAHGICLRVAARDGGLVCPALYYGTGGGHAHYPWTVMMDGDAEITALLGKTLGRMRDFGIGLVVLLSGHFAPTQLAIIERVAAEWNAAANPRPLARGRKAAYRRSWRAPTPLPRGVQARHQNHTRSQRD